MTWDNVEVSKHQTTRVKRLVCYSENLSFVAKGEEDL